MELIIINIIEVVSMTWFLMSLLDIKKRNVVCAIVLTLVDFIIITLSNYISVYDIFLTTLIIVVNTIILNIFSDNEMHEVLFVSCLETVYLGFIAAFSYFIFNLIPTINISIIARTLYIVLALFVIRFLKNKNLYFKKSMYYMLSFILFILQFVISNLFQLYLFFEPNHPELAISFALFLFCVIGLIYLLVKMSEMYKNSLSYERMMQEKANQVVIAELYDQIRIMKHDLKHLFQLILHYLKIQNYDEIQRVVDIKAKEVKEIPTLVYTKNELINTIVNHKLIHAFAKNLETQCEISVGNVLSITDYDLNDLLSNVLDNAIENCAENGTIQIRINQEQQFLHLQVSNSINHTTDFKTKKDTKYHGLGLKSIGRIVDKYNGVQKIEQTEDIYTIRISLSLNQ